jgi:hypothetical protein
MKEVSWFLAVVVTLYIAILQFVMESAYPLQTEVNTGKQKINLELIRSFEGDSICPVILPITDIAISGYLIYNLKTDSLRQEKIMLRREGDKLIGFLPAQIPSTEMEYRIYLEKEKKPLIVNDNKPVLLKFKGIVPFYLIFSTCLIIAVVLFLSILTGFYAMLDIKSYKWILYLTLVSSLFLCFFLYPLYQKYSLNNWIYIPKIWNLNAKIFSISLIWSLAFLLSLRRSNRLWTVLATFFSIIIFLIPHTNTNETVKITFNLLERNFITLLQLF